MVLLDVRWQLINFVKDRIMVVNIAKLLFCKASPVPDFCLTTGVQSHSTSLVYPGPPFNFASGVRKYII